MNESGVPEVSEPRPGVGEPPGHSGPESLAAIYELAESVRDSADFGALLDAVAGLAGLSRGDVGRALNRSSSVYEWFRGSTIPATRPVARELAVHLDRAVTDRHPDEESEVGDALLSAWDRLAEQRRLARVARGRSRHRPPSRSVADEPDTEAFEPDAEAAESDTEAAESERPDAVAPVPPVTVPVAAERRPRSRRRDRGVALLAVVLLLGAAAGFAAARALIAATRARVAPCAEAIAPHHSSGYVQLNIGYGPPGDPMASQRVELRVQRAEDKYEWATAGWIAYAHLVQRVSERDEVWLEWRSDEDGDGNTETYTCPATEVNRVLQTVGIRVRDPYGERRWFRACAAVPQELAVPGRSRNNCTGWERPDD